MHFRGVEGKSGLLYWYTEEPHLTLISKKATECAFQKEKDACHKVGCLPMVNTGRLHLFLVPSIVWGLDSPRAVDSIMILHSMAITYQIY